MDTKTIAPDTARIKRGVELAATATVERHGGPHDLVTVRGYVVSLEYGACSCKDFEHCRKPCKHLYAATVAAAHAACRPARAKLIRH
ncbi:MAG: SWIM zinc finger family protein [Actinomycetota bacterium]|nr:SWIM zinc finger family protein [Actinomycetota bacterium]